MQESEVVPFTMTEKAEIMLKEKESLFLTETGVRKIPTTRLTPWLLIRTSTDMAINLFMWKKHWWRRSRKRIWMRKRRSLR